MGDPEGSVDWQSCDLLAVVDEDETMIESLSSILTGADGVISCVGAFGNSEYMERVCGDVTVAASRIAASTGVPNFAFVSASEYGGLPETLAPGYFAGKRKAEAAIAKTFPDSGLVVRPGAIGGNRYVSSLDRNVPVGCLLKPLELVTKFSPVTKLRQDVLPGFVGKLLTPPMDVEVLARLVVDGALGDRAGTFTVD